MSNRINSQVLVLLIILAKKYFYIILDLCGSNSMARVPAFQAGCCEFESRLPLFYCKGLDLAFLMFKFILFDGWGK